MIKKMTSKHVKHTIERGMALQILQGLRFLAKRKTGHYCEAYDDMIYFARQILENYDNDDWWRNK